jgi:hypothetical protein
MAHELKMGNDGIIRLSFIGDISKEDVEAYERDLLPYLDAATETSKLNIISYSGREGKYSSDARRRFTELNKDLRVGRVAILGGNRFNRVMATIILKATGRQNIRFFDTEEEAVAWLKEAV